MTKTSESTSVAPPLPPGFFLRAHTWWVGGILAGVLLSTLLLLNTPVEFQSTLRIAPFKGSSDLATTAQGELLASFSSIETRQRVATALTISESPSGANPPFNPEEVLPQSQWTALLGAQFKTVASPSGATHLMVRSTHPEQVAPLAQAIAKAGVAVFEERQLRHRQDTLRLLNDSLDQLQPTIATLRSQGLSRYDAVIQDLGQRLNNLNQPGQNAHSKTSPLRRQLEISFQAAVLQRAELETGLPMGQNAAPHRLLGVDGQRLQELESARSRIEMQLADPRPSWEIATDLKTPVRQLPRVLALPILLALLLPVTLVAIARLFVELP